MKKEILFNEKQRITQWWIWVLLSLTLTFQLYVFIQQIFLKKPVGSNPMPDLFLIGSTLFLMLLLIFIYRLQLETTIDSEKIIMRYRPLIRKTFYWSDIEKAEIIDYGFVGGFGVRLGTKFGTVYNTKGSFGLLLELSNGKKLVIGTQEPQKIKDTLDKLHKI